MHRIGHWFRNFMKGRYGNDKLNMVILGTGLVLVLVYTFIPSVMIKLILWALSYVLMFWAIFRSLSRNTYRSYQENRKFWQFFERLKDRQHRYFDCPKCRQTVRVPRGKGKISISCPKCKEKFTRNT